MFWGAGSGVYPLLFSSLSCPGVKSPAGPCTSKMGGDFTHLLQKEASDSVLKTRTAQWECFNHPHRRAEATDREPLWMVLGTEVRMAQNSASGKGARFTGLISVPSPDPSSSSSSSVAAGGSCISSGKA